MNGQKAKTTPEEFTGITLDSGKSDVPIMNERGEQTGVFRFNPTDLDMVSRYNRVAEEFNKVLEPLANGGDDDTDPLALMNEAGNRIIELMDYVLGGNSKEAFFAECSPLSLRNGRFYCEDVFDAVGAFISKKFDTEVSKMLAPGDFRQKVPGDFRHFAPEEFSQF